MDMDKIFEDLELGNAQKTGWLSFFVGVPIISLATSFAFCLLWRWFLVPLGVLEISLAHAFGITCLISFVAPSPVDRDKKRKPLDIIMIKVIAAALAIGIGYSALLAMKAGW